MNIVNAMTRFWKTHQQGKVILLAIWDTGLGETQGYWRGFMAFTDDHWPGDRPYSLHVSSSIVLPELDDYMVFHGFVTMDRHDVNVGPRGETGYRGCGPLFSPTTWTKAAVFKKLKRDAKEYFEIPTESEDDPIPAPLPVRDEE